MGNTITATNFKRRKVFNDEIINYWNLLKAEGKEWETKRNNKMRRLLIEKFQKCQACKYPNRETRNSYILEGAHINPKYPDGTYDNSPLNLIALCPNCHTILDNGTVDDSLEIAHKVQKNYPGIPYKFPDTHRLFRPWWKCCYC